jgi:predicted TIM-barrel fold metal-dependent hydrolase
MLLSHTVDDPTLRATNFVLLHGGNPFSRHLTSMILKPNVYADFSVIELEFSPAELARILRPWLEFMPEHILYGTDAGFFSPGMEWVEATWAGSHNARRALAIVLTEMMKDGTITTSRAKEIASQVLGENAAKLYHLALTGAANGGKAN